MITKNNKTVTKKLKNKLRHEYFDYIINNQTKFNNTINRLKTEGFYQPIEKTLLKNNPSIDLYRKNHHALDYYVALFHILLSTNHKAFNLNFILRSINRDDKDAFYYFIYNILSKSTSIIPNATNSLVLSIITTTKNNPLKKG